MSPRKHLCFALMILALIGGGIWRAHNARQLYFVDDLEVMGTFARVQFWENTEEKGQAAATVVWDTFNKVNDRFSNYTKESELSRLNATAFEKPFECSPEMWDMLKVCREAYRVSHGAFDISAGPLVKLWGMYRKEKKTLPSAEEIAEARKRVGLDKIVFDDAKHTVRFTLAGMYIDVGGIAKGYAVDQAVEKLKAMGIKRGIVDLAGNMYCFGGLPKGRKHYTIGIRHPFLPFPANIGFVPMHAQAIATSGDYERFVVIDGKRYAHIMDTRTGLPIQGMASVSVIASSATVTDMLSTSIFINGGKFLDELAKQYPGIKVMIVTKRENEGVKVQQYPAGDPIWNHIEPVADWKDAAEGSEEQ